MIVKTKEEIAIMAEGGAKLGAILQKLLDKAQPGVSLMDIETLADQLIRQAGGEASFKTVKGYKWATCLCVNDVVVHGIPTVYMLKDGDLLTIDVGMLYKGFHTDTAWTKIIGYQTVPSSLRGAEATKQSLEIASPRQPAGSRDDKQRFLEIGQEALWKAIDQARPGNRVGHISQTIQRIVEGAGFGIVKTLVGHGVGRELHEAPQIPGFLKGPIEATPVLVKDMTIAVEVIYAMGSGAVVYSNDDGWSIATRDGSLTAVFEHTIAVTDGEPQVLTKAV
ncbi:MAG: M24 family metallopeptidase [Patescibacteria group bacterium]